MTHNTAFSMNKTKVPKLHKDFFKTKKNHQKNFFFPKLDQEIADELTGANGHVMVPPEEETGEEKKKKKKKKKKSSSKESQEELVEGDEAAAEEEEEEEE